MANTQPKIPEISASPLLNKPVVDKPISDPLFSQGEQPRPQPQQPTQSQQPTPPPQPPQQPIPGDIPGDPSTSHLSPPHPADDPTVKTMSFDEPTSSMDDDTEDEGGKQEFKLPKTEVQEFAKVIVQIGSMYIPVFLSKFAKIKIAELELGEHQGVFPQGTVNFFKQINEKTEQGLAIAEEEQVMLLSALKSYLAWKNIEAANPGTALSIAVGAVILRLGITTAQFMAENRAIFQEFLAQYPNLEGEQQPVKEPTNKKEG